MINKTIKLIPMFLIILVSSFKTYSQVYSVNNISKIRFGDIDPIIEDGVVRGYSVFYFNDKVAKGKNSYKIQLLDENLNLRKEIEIIKEKGTSLIETATNESGFSFLFYNGKAGNLEYDGYNKKLEKTGSFSGEKLSRRELMLISSKMVDESSSNSFLFPAGENGFLYYKTKNENKIGYEIVSLDNSTKKMWSIGSKDDSKILESAAFVDAGKTILLSAITKFKNAFDRNPTVEVLATNMENGNPFFNVILKDDKYNLAFNNAYVDEEKNQVIIMGDYYNISDKTITGKSLGYFVKVFDLSGKEIIERYLSWEQEMSKFLPVNKKGKLQKDGYIYLHKTVRTSNGKIFFIGEQFKKQIDGLGTAISMVGGGGHVEMKMVILNMMIFQFTENFDLEKVETYEKEKSQVLLGDYSYGGVMILAKLLKSKGYFDYKYTQQNKNLSNFSSVYVDYDRKFSDKTKNKLGVISYSGDGGLSEDKIELPAKSQNFFILPAKPGNVFVGEYFKKEKKVELRLEKVNF